MQVVDKLLPRVDNGNCKFLKEKFCTYQQAIIIYISFLRE